MKRTLLILLSFLVMGCGSKKKITENSNSEHTEREVVTEIVYDTVYKDRVIEKIKPVFSEVEVPAICDDNGNLLPLNFTIGSGNNTTSVFSKDGKLYINQKIDSVRNTYEKEYRARWQQDSINLRKELLRESDSHQQTTRTRYPWWFYGLMILSIVAVIYKISERFSLLGRIKAFLWP